MKVSADVVEIRLPNKINMIVSILTGSPSRLCLLQDFRVHACRHT
jgi:hypothetical protein